MMRNEKIFVLAMMASLAACGPADDAPGPGGVSVEDSRALDKAAAQLDEPPITTEHAKPGDK